MTMTILSIVVIVAALTWAGAEVHVQRQRRRSSGHGFIGDRLFHEVHRSMDRSQDPGRAHRSVKGGWQ